MSTHVSARTATFARLVLIGGLVAAVTLIATTASAQLQGKGGNYWTAQVSPAVQREQLRKMREGRAQRAPAKSATAAATRVDAKVSPRAEVASPTEH